ncbi:hypothetical protein F5878DRAFT_639818 [Lentinula raphanica]|uniref:Transcription factor TFIIB cyclin-like domain-containing protein n=1 Tax=Lentinula raphanica TaxID=153919 RepID=A0AA38PDX2_9AGAR|nr:hypothetical protein F5878DRAFT_639818 [Lentinula raphanica]
MRLVQRFDQDWMTRGQRLVGICGAALLLAYEQLSTICGRDPVCLCVACRQKETKNYMLIDFSDILQNSDAPTFNSSKPSTSTSALPLVDPSHYPSRFAALLEFGDETHRVATNAVRLVQRFYQDWMTHAKRPAGICGADDHFSTVTINARDRSVGSDPNYMLIDFSDILQVNVLELGRTYLQLIQTLNLNLRLPLVDPSHYPSCFAALLEFGEEIHRVAPDAVRLVERFSRSTSSMFMWRRPLPCRAYEQRLTIRGGDHSEYPSCALTLADFRTSLEEEMATPAYTKAKAKEDPENLRQSIDPALMNKGILAGESWLKLHVSSPNYL